MSSSVMKLLAILLLCSAVALARPRRGDRQRGRGGRCDGEEGSSCQPPPRDRYAEFYEYQCLSGFCRRVYTECQSDAECDVSQGYECKVGRRDDVGKCMKVKATCNGTESCTPLKDCTNGLISHQCVQGLCEKQYVACDDETPCSDNRLVCVMRDDEGNSVCMPRRHARRGGRRGDDDVDQSEQPGQPDVIDVPVVNIP